MSRDLSTNFTEALQKARIHLGQAIEALHPLPPSHPISVELQGCIQDALFRVGDVESAMHNAALSVFFLEEKKPGLGEIEAESLYLLLQKAAENAYESEVVQTNMEHILIGPEGEFADKADWIASYISGLREEIIPQEPVEELKKSPPRRGRKF